MRISTSSPHLHSQPQTAHASATKLPDANEPLPLQTVLFGATLPKAVDPASYPQLAEQLRWLMKQKAKIATFVGDKDEEYAIVLSEGEAACIDQHNRIFLGVDLVARSLKEQGLLVGILAHEIGHRPKTWKRVKHDHGMKRAQLAELAKMEEAKADRVAGRALAEMGLLPDELCQFLLAHGHFEKQPEAYFPVDMRVELIRDAHASQIQRSTSAQKLFPQFQRAQSVKGLIHDGKATSAPRKKRRIARSF